MNGRVNGWVIEWVNERMNEWLSLMRWRESLVNYQVTCSYVSYYRRRFKIPPFEVSLKSSSCHGRPSQSGCVTTEALWKLSICTPRTDNPLLCSPGRGRPFLVTWEWGRDDPVWHLTRNFERVQFGEFWLIGRMVRYNFRGFFLY